MSAQLRVTLPRLDALEGATALDYLLLDRQGKFEAQGTATPAELARLGRGRRLVAWLHGDDAVQTTIELPPLPAARIGDAVRCAAQGLVLGDAAQLHIAHGPREADGQVAVAWASLAALHGLSTWSQRADLRWRALHPTPEPGCQAQPLPSWGLHGALQRGPAQAGGWGRAAACVGCAVLVWVLGLNLHASRLADEGAGLRQQMQTQVRQAFPHLPVILNPLQQVRQQLAAGATPPGAEVGFAGLMQAAGMAMPFLAGSIEQLDYSDAGLELVATEDASKAPPDASWQATLASQGIEAQATAHGWRLRPLPLASDAAEVANAQ